jgi:two-component system NtrC family sensor kinase
LAKQYFSETIQVSQRQYNLQDLAEAFVSLANLFSATGNRDSSLWYAKKGLEIFQSIGSPEGLVNAYTSLSSIYKLLNNMDSAFLYQGLAMAAKDSLKNVEKMSQFQSIGFDEQLRLRELEEEKIHVQNKIRSYALLAGIAVFMLIAFLLFRNNRNRRKANTLLQKQKEEIERQKKNVEQTLTELKATQSQLIQSEKMASLGELTAGIAHEIQNPLNFVNNFSEVNTELIDEMQQALQTGNTDEALAISNDLKDNEQKIIHHGKRADAIVKGMLQHSRISTGQKEPTDINALADEYLRLSYHGMRAKDKTFNATLKTELNESIGKINIVPQDIGRVLLNLFNNAFYSVAQKKKQIGDNYEPTISVYTKNVDSKIEIHVRDNGIGISQKVVDKIFQPFLLPSQQGREQD